MDGPKHRDPPHSPRDLAIDRFLLLMEKACRGPREGLDDVADAQWCYRQSFVAVSMLVRDLGGDTYISDHFSRAAEIFEDLLRGVVDPMLAPRKRSKRGGRTPYGTQMWVARALTVIAYKFFRAASLQHKEAIRTIEGAQIGLSCLLENKADLASSIGSWHRAFKDGKVRSLSAYNLWSSYQSHGFVGEGQLLQAAWEALALAEAAAAKLIHRPWK